LLFRFDDLTFVLFMKVGLHAGEPLDSIILRKRDEERASGFLLWGYGGTLCHPAAQIRPFAEQAMLAGSPMHLAMVQTKSKHFGAGQLARESSTDAIAWAPLPTAVKVTGSRFALVCKGIQRVDQTIDLARYVVAVGPNTGRSAAAYLRGRVDKACTKRTSSVGPPAWATVSYVAELVSPHAVYVR
jgi:hypothetical protein